MVIVITDIEIVFAYFSGRHQGHEGHLHCHRHFTAIVTMIVLMKVASIAF